MSGKATESDILAWIEGELPEDRASAVEAAFEEDPSLRAWASSMQGDRSTLRAWSERALASAPTGLAESALEFVEREALLGPSEAEVLAALPERESSPLVFRIRRYATAAAIVLLVGVLAVTGVRFGPSAFNGGVGEVVRVDPEQTIRLQEESSGDPHTDLLDAIASAERDDLLESVALKSSESPTPIEEQQVASLSRDDDVSAFQDMARRGLRSEASRPMGAGRDTAALLADVLGQGAIAGGPVIAIAPEVAAASMERLTLRVWADDPAGLSRSMQSRCQAPDSPAVGWSVISDGSDPEFGITGAVCTVRLPGELAGLEWLVGQFEEAGAGRVELTLREETARSGRGLQGAGKMNAARALWWGEPISSWAWSVRVGVLIEPSGASNTE